MYVESTSWENWENLARSRRKGVIVIKVNFLHVVLDAERGCVPTWKYLIDKQYDYKESGVNVQERIYVKIVVEVVP